jgi:hypothetical protein
VDDLSYGKYLGTVSAVPAITGLSNECDWPGRDIRQSWVGDRGMQNVYLPKGKKNISERENQTGLSSDGWTRKIPEYPTVHRS